jgi:hypothetical protein
MFDEHAFFWLLALIAVLIFSWNVIVHATELPEECDCDCHASLSEDLQEPPSSTSNDRTD